MLRLRLSEVLTEEGYQRKLGRPLPARYRKNARRFQAHGLAESDSRGIRLTRRGFLVSNQLIGEILWGPGPGKELSCRGLVHKAGLAEAGGRGIRLTRRGFLVSNQLIGEILW